VGATKPPNFLEISRVSGLARQLPSAPPFHLIIHLLGSPTWRHKRSSIIFRASV
jgi:hypothetical protein